MSTPGKSKLYILIIGILLVTNIVMLFFFLNKDGKRNTNNHAGNDRRAMMRDFLQNQVGFNDSQIQQYDTLSKQFKAKTQNNPDSLRGNKEEQFKVLGTKGFSDAAIDSIVSKSAENQKIMELQMMDHFVAIRKLCTADQQPKFDSLFYKIWSKKKRPDDKKPEEKK